MQVPSRAYLSGSASWMTLLSCATAPRPKKNGAVGFGLLEGPTLTLMHSVPAHVSARRSASCAQHCHGSVGETRLHPKSPSNPPGTHTTSMYACGLTCRCERVWSRVCTTTMLVYDANVQHASSCRTAAT